MTIWAIAILCVIGIAVYCTREPKRSGLENGTRIELIIKDTVLHATLNNTRTSLAFQEQLPKTYSVSKSSVDICGGATDLPSDRSERQTGWKIGDIDYGGGWFMIFHGGQNNIPFLKMMVIGSIDENDIAKLNELNGNFQITVQKENE